MGTPARGAPTPRHPIGLLDAAWVTSWNARVGAVTLVAGDIIGLGGVLLPTPPLVFGKTIYADGIGGTFWADPTGGSGGAVTSFGSPHRTGAVVLTPGDITGLGGVLLPTPPMVFGKTIYADGTGGTFWGDPSGGSGGVTSWNTRVGAVHLVAGDIIALGGVLLPTPPSVFGKMLYADGSGGTFWGDAPSGGGGGGVSSFGGRVGAVSLTAGDIISLGGVLCPNPSGVAFGKQLTADGSGGTFWG